MKEKYWLVLLRAVNIGGRGKLPMAELRKVLSDSGFRDVKTYIQTGNILVSTPLSRSQVESRVEEILIEHFDLSRPALALTYEELDLALNNNPFPEADEIPQRLHLMFLKGSVRFDPEAFEVLCDNGEQFALIDKVFYLYTPNGAAKSKAANRYEKFVNCDMITARNLNSCKKILALAKN